MPVNMKVEWIFAIGIILSMNIIAWQNSPVNRNAVPVWEIIVPISCRITCFYLGQIYSRNAAVEFLERFRVAVDVKISQDYVADGSALAEIFKSFMVDVARMQNR